MVGLLLAPNTHNALCPPFGSQQERMKNAKQAAEAQDMKRKHMQAFIDRFRYNANRAALVQSRIKALERLAGGRQ